MDLRERLSYEDHLAPRILPCAHAQRYGLAARLVAGLRVVDLACGTGEGTAVLAASASHVVGVDHDVAGIEAARARHEGLEFVAAAAARFLETRGAEFDAIVLLDAPNALVPSAATVEALTQLSASGRRIIASAPNPLVHRSPGCTSALPIDVVLRDLQGLTVLRQHALEGCMLGPADAPHSTPVLLHPERAEDEYASHLIVLSNCPPDHVAGPAELVVAAPEAPRYLLGLETANRELRQVNARLARGLVGRSAAGAARSVLSSDERIAELEASADHLQGLARHERQRGDDEHARRIVLEHRVAELEAILASGPKAAAAAARRLDG